MILHHGSLVHPNPLREQSVDHLLGRISGIDSEGDTLLPRSLYSPLQVWKTVEPDLSNNHQNFLPSRIYQASRVTPEVFISGIVLYCLQTQAAPAVPQSFRRFKTDVRTTQYSLETEHKTPRTKPECLRKTCRLVGDQINPVKSLL